MVSVGEIENIRQEIQKKVDYLRILNNGYEKSIDECDPAGISSYAHLIARSEDVLDTYKDHLTIRQEQEIDDLKRQYALQFQRINLYKVCECKQKKDSKN